MSEYRVPQDVLSSRKIFGPLTFNGFLICCGSGLLSYMMSRLFVDAVWPVLVIIISSMTILFVFVKIRGMSFSQYILARLLYHLRPRKRVWIMNGLGFDVSKDYSTKEKKVDKNAAKKKAVAHKIALADNIDDVIEKVDSLK